MQRAGDGSRGQGEHIDLGAKALEPLLVGHPEALLFIDDQKAQILEANVFGQQAMGAHHRIDSARGQTFDRGHLLPSGLETR